MSHPHEHRHHERRHSNASKGSKESGHHRHGHDHNTHDVTPELNYTTTDSHGHVHHHHQKFMLVHEGRDNVAHTVIPSGKERIEVYIHQGLPQRIANDGTGMNREEMREYNPWLAEDVEARGPNAKRKRGNENSDNNSDEDYENPMMISEGTGGSMSEITGNDLKSLKNRSGRKNVDFNDKVKVKNVGKGGDEPEDSDYGSYVGDESNPKGFKRQSGGRCPLCGVGTLQEEFTWTGILSALLCFPCGLYILFTRKAIICSHCRQVFHQ